MLLLALAGLAVFAQEGRDPFRPPEAPPVDERPAGLAGWMISEVRIRGVLVMGGAREGLAVLESPPGEGFVARPGDALLDGILSGVDANGVFFVLRSDPGDEMFRPLPDSREESR